MPNVRLYPYQAEAVEKMHNGCILCGGVGTGKSCTSLAYVYTKILGGSMRINAKGTWKPPTVNKPIYLITTAKKRDTHEWEAELYRFGLNTDPDISANHIPVTIDSWNNIKKYTKVYGAMFIFDEDRITGSGAWVKAFLQITRKNQWIVLSASPGDSFVEYVPVWIANGYFKNRTDFNSQHVIFKPFRNFPIIDDYRDKPYLEYLRRQVLVPMFPPYEKKRIQHKVICAYDKVQYHMVWKERWNIYKNEPIDETGTLFYVLRKLVNLDPDRRNKLHDILGDHPKAIIFYNFSDEYHQLKQECESWGFKVAAWNGEVHEDVPTGNKWVYLCQYTAAAEGWNCITTDTLIFYSLSYSYKSTIQAAGRINRLNSPYEELHYFYMQSKAPIDVAILRALHEKRNFNERSFLKKEVKHES